jgi:hypothetical protein
MDDREQQQRERAYKIWEDEGRLEGAHEEHWQRAGIAETNQGSSAPPSEGNDLASAGSSAPGNNASAKVDIKPTKR